MCVYMYIEILWLNLLRGDNAFHSHHNTHGPEHMNAMHVAYDT